MKPIARDLFPPLSLENQESSRDKKLGVTIVLWNFYVREGAGMEQWWEHSPPTNVARVRFPVDRFWWWHLGWVCCWFSSLLWGFFSGYSGFPPSTKTNIPKFQFDLETVNERATLWKPLKFLFINTFSPSAPSMKNSHAVVLCEQWLNTAVGDTLCLIPELTFKQFI